MHDAPIFRFNAAKPAIVEEVVQRVVEGTREPLLALNDAAYLEIRRLGSRSDASAEWRDLAGHLGKMDATDLRKKLQQLAERYAWDVAGNFDPRVYKFASRAMAPLLGALLSPRAALKHLPEMHSLAALDDRIVVQGPTDHIAHLATLGTLCFVPTHLSNLDSVVFGFALERAGLPPATYGAGKNLFTNPVLSFFMHNLGAYRVDRRLKHVLYKDVLKAYSSVLLERGYHSLFFPGGTRSRSGMVERRLKLGLAGTGVEAYTRTAQRGKPQPIFFVPATINYLLTLEAETLIDDFLQEEGKHRYIIEDDESTRVSRVAAFAQKLMGLDASVVIRFSSPLDCFGNVVDEGGRSHDERGREVDALTYLYGEGDAIVRDSARDAQYTRELGESICRAFRRDTVVMATHLVAATAFDVLQEKVGRKDLFALVNYRERVQIPRDEFTTRVQQRLDALANEEKAGRIVLSAQLHFARAREVIDVALRAFAGYHSRPGLISYGGDIVLEDARLLFYYQNRLAAHGLAFDTLKH